MIGRRDDRPSKPAIQHIILEIDWFQMKSFDPKWHFLTCAFDIFPPYYNFKRFGKWKDRIPNMPLSKQAAAEKFESFLKEEHSQRKEA